MPTDKKTDEYYKRLDIISAKKFYAGRDSCINSSQYLGWNGMATSITDSTVSSKTKLIGGTFIQESPYMVQICKSNKMQSTLFLDVDNTLIVSKDGSLFPTVDNWVFKAGILETLIKKVREYDQVILVTNQGGVDAGFKTPQEVERYISEVCHGLEVVTSIQAKTFIAYINEDRKPVLGNFIKDLTRLNELTHLEEYAGLNYDAKVNVFDNINLNQSTMVGDASGLTRVLTKKGKFVRLGKDLEIAEEDEGYIVKKDFSDSDKLFAENMGVFYQDIEEFLNK